MPGTSGYRMQYTAKSQRLERRRRAQETPEFKKQYRKRAGVEGLMSALKRGYGFGRLRVRGMAAVRMELYLKAAGYNLKQAAKWAKSQAHPPTDETDTVWNRPFSALRRFLRPIGARPSRLRTRTNIPRGASQEFKTRPVIRLHLHEMLLAG